jgi:hypothetical protein
MHCSSSSEFFIDYYEFDRLTDGADEKPVPYAQLQLPTRKWKE